MKGHAHLIPLLLFEEFTRLLADRMGLYFPTERWGELEKKLIPVCQTFGFKDDLPACLEWMLKTSLNKEQITVLAYHLTIGETYFFRDQSLYAILEKRIFPEIIQRREHEKEMRIWSAGCCTGEEPYSIAILLNRMIPDIKKWDVKILGSDINHEFLRKAEEARYKKWSFRAIPPNFIDTYFIPQEDGSFLLIPHFRHMVKFMELNLVQDSFPNKNSGIDEFDLILCHNVLIYFSKSQIKKTVHNLTKSLREKGWLSVAPVEAPFVSDPSLETNYFSGYTLFKKEAKVSTGHVQVPKLQKPIPTKIPKQEAKEGDILLKVVLPAFLNPQEPILEMRFSSETPSLTKKEVEIVKEKVSPIDVKETIRNLLKKGDRNSALELCQKAIQEDNLNPLLYTLLGTIYHADGNFDNALDSLKKASFLDANFIAPHYLLGMFYSEKGKNKEAKKEFKTVLNLLSQHSSEEILPGLEELNAGQLKDLLMRFK